ncbi:hypothetical protein [Ramlibacter sp.]|uniref:hypothetical protein n=1 Tax=Ramlibacter sp. TaxID=1917967 RepID=UPI00261976BC|nr:hypothetical protein [Ramlibacter sp.]
MDSNGFEPCFCACSLARTAESPAGKHGQAVTHAHISETVLERAAQLAGDMARARHWYFNCPLPEFGGQTAEAAVANGREADVLDLLDMYEAGPLG